MMQSGLVQRIVLGGTLVLAVVACSSAGGEGSGQVQDASSGQNVSVPANPGGSSAEGGVTEVLVDVASMDVLHQMYAELKQSANRFNASCMSDRGFPQLIEANLMAGDTQRFTLPEAPMLIDPLNFGPYTVEQAEHVGIDGVMIALVTDRPSPGNVGSRDDAFDEVADACRDEFDAEHGDEALALRDLDAAYGDLLNTVETEFGEELDGRHLDLNVERLECLAQRRPDFDLSAALADGLGGFLQAGGVAAGVIDDRTGELPVEPEPGTVFIFPANPPVSYLPSEAEVEFALDFVACSEEINYLPRIVQLQAAARGSVLERHEIAILGMIETIEAQNLP